MDDLVRFFFYPSWYWVNFSYALFKGCSPLMSDKKRGFRPPIPPGPPKIKSWLTPPPPLSEVICCCSPINLIKYPFYKESLNLEGPAKVRGSKFVTIGIIEIPFQRGKWFVIFKNVNSSQGWSCGIPWAWRSRRSFNKPKNSKPD